MRSYDPSCKYDTKELSRLNAEPWMVEALQLNPGYTCWGPYEDYMTSGKGWSEAQHYETWKDFDFGIDELNECVNFYFEINRDSQECTTCEGDGYHPDAKWITESFYKHSSPFYQPHKSYEEHEKHRLISNFLGGSSAGYDMQSYPSHETLQKYPQSFRDFANQMKRDYHWSDKITDDEFEALKEAGRNWGLSSAEEVNRNESSGVGHDAINRGILIQKRCERLGVPHLCPDCEGHGYVYTQDKGHLALVLWYIHPRKGASRPVRIARLQKEDMQSALELLRKAANSNAQRFARVFQSTEA
jgi:hypothetical protein